MNKPDPKDKPEGATAVGSRDLFGVVEQRWWECTLATCPPGLFLHGETIGFKTEYSDANGPEAYVVASGEYFWGGTDDKEVRRNLKVIPVIITPNDQAEPKPR
jgi:hypothetical protein